MHPEPYDENIMKKVMNRGGWLLLLVVTLLSCKKSEKCDPEDERSACYSGPNSNYYSMVLEGKDWKAGGKAGQMAIAEWGEFVENEETKLRSLPVMLTGTTADGNELFLIQLYFSADMLKDPRGSYQIITDITKIGLPGTAEVMLTNKKWSQGVAYQSRIGKKGSPDAGTVTVTEFRKGKGSLHFAQLKGTFKGIIYEFDAENGRGVTGKTMAMQEGKFNLFDPN